MLIKFALVFIVSGICVILMERHQKKREESARLRAERLTMQFKNKWRV